MTSLLPPLGSHLGNSIPNWPHIIPPPVPQLLLTRDYPWDWEALAPRRPGLMTRLTVLNCTEKEALSRKC